MISGAKRFITNAPMADLFVVFARTDPEARGTRGISVFLVEAGGDGVRVGPKDRKTGQAGAWTAEVLFDQVRVPASALVGGQEGAGFGEAMKSLVRGRVHIAAICVGMAERLLAESVAHARSSRQGGQPIGEFQLVQAMLADIQTGRLRGPGDGGRGGAQLRLRRRPQDRPVGGQAVLLGDGRPRGRPGGPGARRARLHARRACRADVPGRPAVPHL